MKNCKRSGNSGWFYRLVVKRHAEVARVSSTGLGGKKQEKGDSTVGPAASPRQVGPMHPKSPNPAPKHSGDALEEASCQHEVGRSKGTFLSRVEPDASHRCWTGVSRSMFNGSGFKTQPKDPLRDQGLWEVPHLHGAHPMGCIRREMTLECSFQVIPHISHFFPASPLIFG